MFSLKEDGLWIQTKIEPWLSADDVGFLSKYDISPGQAIPDV